MASERPATRPFNATLRDVRSTEPTITCPNCRTEVKLTESLDGPPLQATRADASAPWRAWKGGPSPRHAQHGGDQPALSLRRRSGGRPGSLLFQRDGDRRVCRQAHRLPFDIRDQPQIDEMMMTFVAPFAAVGLGELDPAVLDAIDGSDMNTVRADHIHMLLYDLAAHFVSPRSRCRRNEGCGRKVRASSERACRADAPEARAPPPVPRCVATPGPHPKRRNMRRLARPTRGGSLLRPQCARRSPRCSTECQAWIVISSACARMDQGHFETRRSHPRARSDGMAIAEREPQRVLVVGPFQGREGADPPDASREPIHGHESNVTFIIPARNNR